MSKILELDRLRDTMDLEVHGKENIPGDYPCVIISNHNRLLDIFYLPLAFDKDIISLVSARLVYKQDVDRLSQINKYLNAFRIEAHGGSEYADMGSRNSSLFLNEGLDVSIFPEGAYIDDTEHVFKGRTGGARVLFDTLESKSFAYFLPVSIDVRSKSELDSYTVSSDDKVIITINDPINPETYYREYSKTRDMHERNEVLHQITDEGMKTIAASLGREYVDEYIELNPKGNVIFSNGETVETNEAQKGKYIRRYEKGLKSLRMTLINDINCVPKN